MYTGWTPQNDTCIYLFTYILFVPDCLISDRQAMDCIWISTLISEPHTIQLLKYSSLPSSPQTQGTPWNNAYPQGSGGEVWWWDGLLQYFLVLPALEGFYAAFMWTSWASWRLGESKKICCKITIHKMIYRSNVDESQQSFTISNKSKPSQPPAFPVHHSLFASWPGLAIDCLDLPPLCASQKSLVQNRHKHFPKNSCNFFNFQCFRKHFFTKGVSPELLCVPSNWNSTFYSGYCILVYCILSIQLYFNRKGPKVII